MYDTPNTIRTLLLIALACFIGLPVIAQQEFITTWETTTAGESITIPARNGLTYNYDVDWDGDGSFDSIGETGSATHNYPTIGVQTIVIRGTFPTIYFNNTGDKDKILSVEQWGTQSWENLEFSFRGCSNLVINATDAPDLSVTISMRFMFSNCTSFNQSINHWDISSVPEIRAMFDGASSFNQDLSDWDVSHITNLAGMFSGATAFNQDLSSWDVSGVINLSSMFSNATAFNQDIGNWDVSSADQMASMFRNAIAFDQDLSNWDVSSVIAIQNMFEGASSFNSNIASWNVGNAVLMSGMFQNATAFNQDISGWDVSSVTTFFNMFDGATAFDRNIGDWDISSATNITDMFLNTGLSEVNYDALLTGWSTLDTHEMAIPNGIVFNAGTSNYCNATAARNTLINTYGWNITDAGLSCITPETSIDLTAGTLTITDTGTPNDEVYTLTNDATTLYIHSSITGIAINGAGVILVDDQTVAIPLAAITTNLIIDGTDKTEGTVFIELDHNFTTANLSVENIFYIEQRGDVQTTTGEISLIARAGIKVDGNIQTTTGDIILFGNEEDIGEPLEVFGLNLFNKIGVHITSSGSLNTILGAIQIFGHGSSPAIFGSESNHGIFIEGNITSTGTGTAGIIDIRGEGQLKGRGVTGVYMKYGTITTGDASVAIYGLGGNTSGGIVSTTDSPNGAGFRDGIILLYSNITSTGLGNINIIGKSGAMVERNSSDVRNSLLKVASDGAYIFNSNIVSVDGNISLSGSLNELNAIISAPYTYDASQGDLVNRQYGFGINLNGSSLIESTGIGDITVTGEGHQIELPADWPIGFTPLSSGINMSTCTVCSEMIKSQDGDITINDSRGKYTTRDQLTFNGLRRGIRSFGNGNITINHYNSFQSEVPRNQNDGLVLGFRDSGGIQTANGDINLNAYKGTYDYGDLGLYFGLDVIVGGTGQLNTFSDRFAMWSGGGIFLSGGGLNITADDLFFQGLTDNVNPGPVFIKNKTSNFSIGLGDNAVGNFQITNDDILRLANATSFSIGDDTTGDIEIDGVTVNDPVSLTGKNIRLNTLSTLSHPLTLNSAAGFHIQEKDPTAVITTSNLIVNGTLSPGAIDAQGTFTVAGDVTFSDNDVFAIDVINAGNALDQLVLQGAPTLTLNDAVLEIHTALYTPVLNEETIIIDVAGTNAVVGMFHNLPQSATFELNGELFKISYNAGDGNDVSLTNVLNTCTSISVFNGFTWDNGIPDANTSAVINGNYNLGSFSCCNLTINIGATLDLDSSTITINGNLENNGSLLGAVGTMEFIGINNRQTITGETMNIGDLIVNNTSGEGITVVNDINVTNRLKLINGNLNTSAGNLTLKSNASNTAMVDVLENGSMVIGEVTVERYIPARRAYRFVTSAVNTLTSINANWQEAANNTSLSVNNNPNPGFGTHITGSMTGMDGFDATASGNNSLFGYDNVNQTWTTVSNTNATNLTAGLPYRLFVRGSRALDLSTNSATPDPTVLRAKGTLETGTITENNLSSTAGAFNFIGNPYQASVDMNAVLAASTNINSNFYYVWDSQLGERGAYATVMLPTGANTSGSAANQFLQPGQAAFTTTVAAGATSLVFEETHKAVGQVTTTFSTPPISSSIVGQLYRKDNGVVTSSVQDSFGIYFSATANNAVDTFDAIKLSNQDETIAIHYVSYLLAIDNRQLPANSESILLSHTRYRVDNYQYKIEINEVAGKQVYLEDAYLATSTLLNDGINLYDFSVDSNNTSSAADRFSLRFENQTLGLEDVDKSISIQLVPNPVATDVVEILINGAVLENDAIATIYNIAGQKLFEQSLQVSNGKVILTGLSQLATATYFVTVTSGALSQTIKLIKK